jgi:hypothetical protein
MRKLILKMHVSIDGFVGGLNGESDWIFPDEPDPQVGVLQEGHCCSQRTVDHRWGRRACLPDQTYHVLCWVLEVSPALKLCFEIRPKQTFRYGSTYRCYCVWLSAVMAVSESI